MMGLRGNPPKAADACLDKFALRQMLSNAGLRTPLLGDAPPGRELGVAAILDGSRMRVLGVVEDARSVSDTPRSALECIPRAARAVGLSCGPIWAHLRVAGEETWFLDLGPSIPPRDAEALQFRIPLVDEDVSLAEVILRHALGMDLARVYRK
jgi:hypothetical protein